MRGRIVVVDHRTPTPDRDSGSASTFSYLQILSSAGFDVIFVPFDLARAGRYTRAIEHLAHIVIEAEMVPLRNSVIIGQIQAAFDPAGDPKNPLTDSALQILLDDLAWWSKLLEEGRARGVLPPGNARLRAAMQAAAEKRG